MACSKKEWRMQKNILNLKNNNYTIKLEGQWISQINFQFLEFSFLNVYIL